MMRGILIVAGLLAVSLGLGQGRAEHFRQSASDDVPWALQKAIKEGPHLRYVGTRTVELRHDGQPQKYTEIITRDGPNTRIEFPSDASYSGQVIVETAAERRQYFPDTNEIQILPPRREEAMSRLARLLKMTDRIHLNAEDGQTIAGVPTTEVVVRDQSGNVMQKLFIAHNGMLLKREMFDAVGTRVGGFEFQKIDFSPNIVEGTFRLERKGAKIVHPIDMLKEAADKAGFPFAHLKPSSGYRLMFTRRSKLQGNEVLIQFYADEGKRVSLFQLKATVDASQLSRFAHDLHVYSWTAGGCTFVLVGGLEPEALRALAHQVTIGN